MYRSGPECFHYRSVALCYAVLRFMYQITFCAATAPLLYCTGSHRSNGNGYIQRSTFCNEKLALRRSGNRVLVRHVVANVVVDYFEFRKEDWITVI